MKTRIIPITLAQNAANWNTVAELAARSAGYSGARKLDALITVCLIGSVLITLAFFGTIASMVLS